MVDFVYIPDNVVDTKRVLLRIMSDNVVDTKALFRPLCVNVVYSLCQRRLPFNVAIGGGE